MTQEIDYSVLGEQDTWMLFERLTADRYPLVVLARTGNSAAQEQLRQGILTIVHCEADLELVNDRGMPQSSDRIYALEEELAKKLTDLGAVVFHVASVTGDGQRRLVYAHAAPVDFLSLLKDSKVDGYTLRPAGAFDREEIVELVTPTALEWQSNCDQAVISNLERNGDDGAVAREANFWFYGEKDRLEGVVRDLTILGYAVGHWLSDPEGVVLTREMSVDSDAFSEATPELLGAAMRHGVEYDG